VKAHGKIQSCEVADRPLHANNCWDAGQQEWSHERPKAAVARIENGKASPRTQQARGEKITMFLVKKSPLFPLISSEKFHLLSSWTWK